MGGFIVSPLGYSGTEESAFRSHNSLYIHIRRVVEPFCVSNERLGNIKGTVQRKLTGVKNSVMVP